MNGRDSTGDYAEFDSLQARIDDALQFSVPFRADSTKRFLILWTDAGFHRRGDSGVVMPYPGPCFETDDVRCLTEPAVSGASVCQVLLDNDIKPISIVAVGDSSPLIDATILGNCAGGIFEATPSRPSVDCGLGTINDGDPIICTIQADGTGIADAIAIAVEAGLSGG